MLKEHMPAPRRLSDWPQHSLQRATGAFNYDIPCMCSEKTCKLPCSWQQAVAAPVCMTTGASQCQQNTKALRLHQPAMAHPHLILTTAKQSLADLRASDQVLDLLVNQQGKHNRRQEKDDNTTRLHSCGIPKRAP